jgi:hypothetical protein
MAGPPIHTFRAANAGDVTTSDERAIADLICDLGHLADERGFDFLDEVKRGIGHWYAERHVSDRNYLAPDAATAAGQRVRRGLDASPPRAFDLTTYPVQLLRRIKAVFRQSLRDFSADGFAQECDSTRRQHLRTRHLVGKTRNKNCWYGETVGEETSMELNPRQTSHMQVGNQTRRVSDTIRIKKIFS